MCYGTVHLFYETEKEHIKEEIKILTHEKFSTTLDEWTSLKNRQ